MPAKSSQRRAQVVIRVAFDVKDDEDIHKIERQLTGGTKKTCQMLRLKKIVASSSARAWREA